MSIYLLIFFGLLTNLAFCQDKGCAYKTYKGQPLDKLNYTDNKYLTSDKTDENKQKCFSLSNSDALNNKCCYKTNSSDHLGYCVDELNNDGSNVECPEDTLIANKCGMALYYQPVSKEACTEISLVDGYCCFVKTKTKGNVCLKQDSIDENKKDESKFVCSSYSFLLYIILHLFLLFFTKSSPNILKTFEFSISFISYCIFISSFFSYFFSTSFSSFFSLLFFS